MLSVSVTCQKILDSDFLEPYIILEIEGAKPLSTRAIQKYVSGVDGPLVNEELSDSLIDLNQSINSISQQIEPDKGVTSLTSARFKIVDEGDLASQLISPGSTLNEILLKRAKIYLAMKGGGHPYDSILFFRGVVESVSSGAGYVDINFVSPDQFKRYEIYQKIEGATVGAVAIADTSIALKNCKVTDLFYKSGGEIQNYVRIDDEVILIGDIDPVGNVITNCVRGQLNTVANSHDPDSQVTSFFRLQGGAIDLSLKTMLSDGVGTEFVSRQMFGFNTDTVNTVANSIFFSVQNIDTLLGLSIGDIITIENNSTPVNNVNFAVITGFQNYPIQNTSRISLNVTVPNTYIPGTSPTIRFLKRNYNSELTTIGFNTDGFRTLPNTIFFNGLLSSSDINVSIGDFLNTSGATNPANNFLGGKITNISQFTDTMTTGVEVNQVLITETVSAQAKLWSKYNTLDARASLGMKPFEVDIERHEVLLDRYGSEMFTYDFYLKDTVKGDEFIHKEIYRPSGLVQIPRNAQASVTKIVTPLGIDVTVELSKKNIINPSKIKSTRSINKYFYNTSTYKYEEDSLADEFLGTEIRVSADSYNRIKLPSKREYLIEAKGIRSLPSPVNIMQVIHAKILERYEFGAEVWEVDTTFGAGALIEVGDVVVLNGEGLNMTDTLEDAGTRDFRKYYCEVVNKTMNIKGGNCKFQLLNTGVSAEFRYGVISPSSRLGVGSTTTRLELVPSYGTLLTTFTEEWKWRDYLGQRINVRNDDYTYSEIVTIQSVGTNYLLVSPPLSSPPPQNYVLEVPPYDVSGSTIDSFYKKAFAFLDPTIPIVSATLTSITVNPSDIGKFSVGQKVFARDYLWNYQTNRPFVKETIGNTIHLTEALTTLPVAGHYVELIGFPDPGEPYVWS